MKLLQMALILATAFATTTGATDDDNPTLSVLAFPTTQPPALKACNPKGEMMYEQCTSQANNDTAVLCQCVSEWADVFKDCESRPALGYQRTRSSCASRPTKVPTTTSPPQPTTTQTIPPTPAPTSHCNPKGQMLFQQCAVMASGNRVALCNCVDDWADVFQNCVPRASLHYQEIKAACSPTRQPTGKPTPPPVNTRSSTPPDNTEHCNPKAQQLFQQCTTLASNDSAALCKCVDEWAYQFTHCTPRASLGFQQIKSACSKGTGTGLGAEAPPEVLGSSSEDANLDGVLGDFLAQR